MNFKLNKDQIKAIRLMNGYPTDLRVRLTTTIEEDRLLLEDIRKHTKGLFRFTDEEFEQWPHERRSDFEIDIRYMVKQVLSGGYL